MADQATPEVAFCVNEAEEFATTSTRGKVTTLAKHKIDRPALSSLLLLDRLRPIRLETSVNLDTERSQVNLPRRGTPVRIDYARSCADEFTAWPQCEVTLFFIDKLGIEIQTVIV